MPKIKLSGLISDIKGKANGSVFARNSGGLYYRNNPSGGGQKTNTWALAKAKLSSLSGKWRHLTQDQRIAWNNAVSNFSTVGAFGDERIPSGYELFMRLNGSLVNIGKPINTVPPVPQSFPDLGIVNLLTPGEFLFTPFHGYAPYNCQGDDSFPGAPMPVQCDPNNPDLTDCWVAGNGGPFSSIPTIDLEKFVIVSQIFVFNSSSIYDDYGSFSLPIFPGGDSPASMSATISFAPDNEFIMHFYIEGPSFVHRFTSVPFKLDMGTPYRLTLKFGSDSLNPHRFFINDNEIESHDTLYGSDLTSLSDVDFSFIPKGEEGLVASFIQSSCIWNEDFTDLELSAITKGYLLGSPLYLYDWAFNKEGHFKNYGSVVTDPTLRAPVMKDPRRSFPKFDYKVSPDLLISCCNNLPSDHVLIVKTTPMGSSGRIGTRSGFKRVAVVDMAGSNTAQIGPEFLKAFGAMISDSFIQVKVQTLSLISGQLSPELTVSFITLDSSVISAEKPECSTCDDCPEGYYCKDGKCVKERKPMKFKPGSELAGSVN